MKKLILIFVCLFTILSLSSCGKEKIVINGSDDIYIYYDYTANELVRIYATGTYKDLSIPWSRDGDILTLGDYDYVIDEYNNLYCAEISRVLIYVNTYNNGGFRPIK